MRCLCIQCNLPFGLCNAPTNFQKAVTKTFKKYLNDFMEVFLDDFSVYGNKKDICNNCESVWKNVMSMVLTFIRKKSVFCVNFGVLLGHIVCYEGLLVDPRKISAITTMLAPVNVIEIKRFLGVVGFYRQYFKDFVNKITPMCKLLKKNE